MGDRVECAPVKRGVWTDEEDTSPPHSSLRCQTHRAAAVLVELVECLAAPINLILREGHLGTRWGFSGRAVRCTNAAKCIPFLASFGSVNFRVVAAPPLCLLVLPHSQSGKQPYFRSLFFTKYFRGFWAFFRLFATTYPGTQKMFKTLSY